MKSLPPIGISSPPHNLSSTVQQYGRDGVTHTVQWQPPQYDGGAPVNYTITVSPGLSPVTTSGTSVPVTVPYNVIHTVSIVATNCNGSSSAAMLSIPAVCVLSCWLKPQYSYNKSNLDHISLFSRFSFRPTPICGGWSGRFMQSSMWAHYSDSYRAFGDHTFSAFQHCSLVKSWSMGEGKLQVDSVTCGSLVMNETTVQDKRTDWHMVCMNFVTPEL